MRVGQRRMDAQSSSIRVGQRSGCAEMQRATSVVDAIRSDGTRETTTPCAAVPMSTLVSCACLVVADEDGQPMAPIDPRPLHRNNGRVCASEGGRPWRGKRQKREWKGGTSTISQRGSASRGNTNTQAVIGRTSPRVATTRGRQGRNGTDGDGQGAIRSDQARRHRFDSMPLSTRVHPADTPIHLQFMSLSHCVATQISLLSASIAAATAAPISVTRSVPTPILRSHRSNTPPARIQLHSSFIEWA